MIFFVFYTIALTGIPKADKTLEAKTVAQDTYGHLSYSLGGVGFYRRCFVLQLFLVLSYIILS